MWQVWEKDEVCTKFGREIRRKIDSLGDVGVVGNIIFKRMFKK
jgi:hypothetical protein